MGEEAAFSSPVMGDEAAHRSLKQLYIAPLG